MTDKQELRRHYAALRDGLSPAERANAEAAIRDFLFSLPAWASATLVCGYIATKSELDLSPVWEKAAFGGKDYALPVTVTDAKDGRMIFRRLHSYTPDVLRPARFGISEPPASCPELMPKHFESERVLMIVPGLAFDDRGYRLGYGGGYYDRYLAALFDMGLHPITVGLAFSACRPSLLPADPHDVPVDYVIDERKVIATHGA